MSTTWCENVGAVNDYRPSADTAHMTDRMIDSIWSYRNVTWLFYTTDWWWFYWMIAYITIPYQWHVPVSLASLILNIISSVFHNIILFHVYYILDIMHTSMCLFIPLNLPRGGTAIVLFLPAADLFFTEIRPNGIWQSNKAWWACEVHQELLSTVRSLCVVFGRMSLIQLCL